LEFKGVVEGFYGPPFRWSERHLLIDFFPEFGFNYYLYGPKGDPYTRKYWARLYPDCFLEDLDRFTSACRERKITINYGLTPGREINLAVTKLNQIKKLGITDFSILFDDLKVELSDQLAQHQAQIANTIYQSLRPDRLFFCPTQYCGRVSSYLKTLGKALNSEIIILWTGPEVVSKRITGAHIRRVINGLKKRVVLWDNYPVNDYDPDRIFLGPFRGRDPAILNYLCGYLANPMNQPGVSVIPLFTLAEFLKKQEGYRPARAIQRALTRFDLSGHLLMIRQFFPSMINPRMSPEARLLKRRDLKRLLPIIKAWQSFDLLDGTWAVENLILARNILLSWITKGDKSGLEDLRFSHRREGSIYFENQVRNLVLTDGNKDLRFKI
jgi:hypothetical protein